MQKFTISGAIAALAVVAAGSAWAETPGAFRAGAKLASPVPASTVAVVEGVVWRCQADACLGLADRYNTLDSVQRECRRVAAVVGPVTAYASRGQRLGRANLAACNRAAGAGRIETALN